MKAKRAIASAKVGRGASTLGGKRAAKLPLVGATRAERTKAAMVEAWVGAERKPGKSSGAGEPDSTRA